MAVLVAASPYALAIATPSALLSDIARAARGGVLIKGGAYLEHTADTRSSRSAAGRVRKKTVWMPLSSPGGRSCSEQGFAYQSRE